MRTPLRFAPPDTSGWPPEARLYVERLQAVIERDRTEVARGVVKIRETLKRHEWLRLGRGSYEHDDNRWRDEVGQVFNAVETALEPLRRVGDNLNDIPVSHEDIAVARGETAGILRRIREKGWMVGVHNDYVLGSKRMTSFWLLMNPITGRFVKGESEDDVDALIAAVSEIHRIENERAA